MIAFVKISLTLSVACVCVSVCRTEEHWAEVMGIEQRDDDVERKSSDVDLIDSVESLLTEERERGIRSLTQDDRADSLTMMNNLRRTVGSSNMPYMPYDIGAEVDAASWTSLCNFDRTVNKSGYVYSMKRITRGMTIANVIKAMYNELPKEVSSVYLTSFGCDFRQCSSADYNGYSYIDAQLTLCLFKGTSEYDVTKYQYEVGEACTECITGSFWCDYGLCRVDCSPSDYCYCHTYCLNCADTNNATCTCQCLDGWTGSRCETQGVGAVTPSCSTTPRVPKTTTTINANNVASTVVPVLQLVFCATVALIVRF